MERRVASTEPRRLCRPRLSHSRHVRARCRLGTQTGDTSIENAESQSRTRPTTRTTHGVPGCRERTVVPVRKADAVRIPIPGTLVGVDARGTPDTGGVQPVSKVRREPVSVTRTEPCRSPLRALREGAQPTAAQECDSPDQPRPMVSPMRAPRLRGNLRRSGTTEEVHPARYVSTHSKPQSGRTVSPTATRKSEKYAER